MIESLKQNQSSDFCLICGAAPAVIGVFIPEATETWGGIKGKSRLILYCLCQACHAKPSTPERAEKIIRCELQQWSVNNAK